MPNAENDAPGSCFRFEPCGRCHRCTPSVENAAPLIRWAETSPEFGSAMPFGSCNAVVAEDEHGQIVCGYPRREDGTCHAGHPAPPQVKPHLSVLPPAATEDER